MNPPFGLIANLPPPRHTRYKSGMGTSTCAICAKHRGTGPLVSPRIFEDDFVVVSHRPPPPHGRSVPGYVFVETRRHVSGLPSLSEPEALAIAHAVWCVSRALDSELTRIRVLRDRWAKRPPLSSARFRQAFRRSEFSELERRRFMGRRATRRRGRAHASVQENRARLRRRAIAQNSRCADGQSARDTTSRCPICANFPKTKVRVPILK